MHLISSCVTSMNMFVFFSVLYLKSYKHKAQTEHIIKVRRLVRAAVALHFILNDFFSFLKPVVFKVC